MFYIDLKDLVGYLKDVLEIHKDGVKILDKNKIISKAIDDLIYNAALNEDDLVKEACRRFIKAIAYEFGIVPASIQGLYEARGKNEYESMTVPAVNIRGLTYDLARALIKAGVKNKSSSFIFEIAKSEIGYTKQRPAEYTAYILAAAIKEDYRGPVFIQADHVQVKLANFNKDRKNEIESLKALIKEEIEAGFYNIDIDSSTLVDLDKETIKEQQRLNFEVAAELTSYIREIEPEGVTVSIGGEIGEVGGKNSTSEELKAYMDGYLETLKAKNETLKGISKISIQTGTSHGGVVLPDGTVAKVKVDFKTLEDLSQIARENYGLAGAVQHGASTLPDDAFDRFPQAQTAEVHLATGFQNDLYESAHLPADLKNKIYDYLKKEFKDEQKEGETIDQFIYKIRKKGFGPFKKELMSLPLETRMAIGCEIEERFNFLFKKLNAVNTQDLVSKFVTPKKTDLKVLSILEEFV